MVPRTRGCPVPSAESDALTVPPGVMPYVPLPTRRAPTSPLPGWADASRRDAATVLRLVAAAYSYETVGPEPCPTHRTRRSQRAPWGPRSGDRSPLKSLLRWPFAPVPEASPATGTVPATARNGPVGDRGRALEGDGPRDGVSGGPSPMNVPSPSDWGPCTAALWGPVPVVLPATAALVPAALPQIPPSKITPHSRRDAPATPLVCHRSAPRGSAPLPNTPGGHHPCPTITLNASTSRRCRSPQATAQQVVPGALLPEPPPQGWQGPSGAGRRRTGRLRPRADRNRRRSPRGRTAVADANDPARQAAANACTSPAAV